MVKAVIFDLDGTLANTLEDLTDAYNFGLKELGQDGHTKEEFRMMVGTGSLDLCRLALPVEREDLIDKLMELSLKYYSDHYLDKTKAYPGIPELLDDLKQRNLCLTVLSNKPDDFTKRITLEMFGPERFCLIRGQCDGLAPKPDPIGVFKILEQLQLNADETLYVGDSATDMDTASAAEVRSVGVSWGFRDRPELQAAGACHIIDHPSELPALLQG